MDRRESFARIALGHSAVDFVSVDMVSRDLFIDLLSSPLLKDEVKTNRA